MKASVVDLRYRMSDVLRALDRNEEVQILYHGKVRGTIRAERTNVARSVREHPFFRSVPGGAKSVAQEMEHLRGGRHRAL